MTITLVSPFSYARPESFIRLEPEAAVLFSILPETETKGQAGPQAKKTQAQEMGDRERKGRRSSSDRGPIPVPSLRGILPKDRGVLRSLPLQQRGTPRFTLRPKKLSL